MGLQPQLWNNLWFPTTGVTRIQSNNQKLGKQELQKHHKDKHIWTSTSYESCEFSCMCLALMCEPS